MAPVPDSDDRGRKCEQPVLLKDERVESSAMEAGDSACSQTRHPSRRVKPVSCRLLGFLQIAALG